MSSFARRLGPVIGALAILSARPALAQAPPAPQPDYHPSLGDLMTMAVQPRHTKLGLAGQARNWPYAAYEASELRNAFARAGRTVPQYRSHDMPAMFAATVGGSMEEVEAAIKASDGRAFDAAYSRLTAACNACHAGLDHAFVVMTAPSASEFPDQAFKPAPKAR